MPRVLIDISRLLGRLMQGRLPTGVDRVGLAYVQHYRQSARAVLTEREVSAVLSEADSRLAFDLLLSAKVRPAQARRLVWKARLWSWMRNDFRLDGSVLLNTSHRGLEHPLYAQNLRSKGVLPVFFIHDLIPITHPEFCRDGEQALHMERLRHALGWAGGIITNSRDTREHVLRLAQAQGWLARPALPVLAALPGSVAMPAPAARPPMAQPYFVVLGTIEPRKNHILLLDVWQKLARQLQGDCPRLVVVGQEGWKCDGIMALLHSDAALAPHVIHLAQCGDAELATWLRHARALLFPSLAEGYGLPLVEALAMGVPVIASELPVFREIAGDVPDYLSTCQEAAWLERVLDYTAVGSAQRAAQLDRMARFQPASWASHFVAVDEFLASVAEQSAGAQPATRGDAP